MSRLGKCPACKWHTLGDCTCEDDGCVMWHFECTNRDCLLTFDARTGEGLRLRLGNPTVWRLGDEP